MAHNDGGPSLHRHDRASERHLPVAAHFVVALPRTYAAASWRSLSSCAASHAYLGSVIQLRIRQPL